jgi:predicted secreted protein
MTPRSRFLSIVLFVAALLPFGARADDNTKPIADVLNIDATVTSDVVPDLAVVTLAIVREGPDVAPLTGEVNQALAKAFAEAKATPGVIASNGGYSTSPRYDSRGNQTTRNGWQVRAQVILKSKDFNALGNLVGKLAQTLQIAGSSFEISPELRAQENATLLDHAARAFQEKALAATRAFGYTGYSIRQVTVGNAGQSSIARPAMMRAAVSEAFSSAPLPIESGQVTLSLTVTGSLQLRK